MDEQSYVEGKPATAEEGGSFFQKWFDLYMNPQRSFESIDQKPDWLLPMLTLAVISAVVMIFMMPIMQQFQIERLMDLRGISRDQAEEILQKAWKIQQFTTPVFVLIGTFIVEFVVAFFFYLVGTVFMGGNASYVKVLSLWAYTSLAVGIVGLAVRAPIMFAKKTMMVQTSLAAFLSTDAKGSLLYKIFGKLDVFVIWQLILAVIGFTVIYKFDSKKSATIIFGLYILWIIVSVLFQSVIKTPGMGA
ncbi:MAG: YIP1 family protein [Calditrichaeota bacterium]|nr:YIP1 family protein [Calditrichota bacterium]